MSFCKNCGHGLGLATTNGYCCKACRKEHAAHLRNRRWRKFEKVLDDFLRKLLMLPPRPT